jgi:hypothetical protein
MAATCLDAQQFDVFRSSVEYLGPTLYKRASWQSPIFALVPREEYPGYATNGNTVFTVERSEPESEDEAWTRVTSVQDQRESQEVETGPCARDWQKTGVGYDSWVYHPEKYEMAGTLLCRNDLPLNWNTAEFWSAYFSQIEHRGAKTLVNRIVNTMMHLVPKAAATGPADFAWVDWDQGAIPLGGASTPTPDLTVLPTCQEVTYCDLTQQMLDNAAVNLLYAGVTAPDSDGWITMADDGPIFPLYIGLEASQRISLNNAEFRLDQNLSWATLAEANPVLKRIGATKVIKNFRHIINLFPPRWGCVAGTFIRVSAFIMINTDGTIWPAGTVASGVPAGQRPTKGVKAVINPRWLSMLETSDISGLPLGAPYEAAIVPNPWVFHDQMLRPINQLRNAKWDPVTYMGDWQFITGSDARSIDSGGLYCADPAHDYGIHWAQYWHAMKPIHPEYGRMILFKRCAESWECPVCS